MSQQQDLNKQINLKRLEILKETIFEWEYSSLFLEYLRKAMSFSSLSKIQVDLITFTALVKMDRPLIMAETWLALQIIKGASPVELCLDLEEYLNFQLVIVKPVEDEWRRIEGEIMDKIEREVQAKSRVTRSGGIITLQ